MSVIGMTKFLQMAKNSVTFAAFKLRFMYEIWIPTMLNALQNCEKSLRSKIITLEASFFSLVIPSSKPTRKQKKVEFCKRNFDEKTYFYVKTQSDEILDAFALTSIKIRLSDLCLAFISDSHVICLHVTDRIHTSRL